MKLVDTTGNELEYSMNTTKIKVVEEEAKKCLLLVGGIGLYGDEEGTDAGPDVVTLLGFPRGFLLLVGDGVALGSLYDLTLAK